MAPLETRSAPSSRVAHENSCGRPENSAPADLPGFKQGRRSPAYPKVGVYAGMGSSHSWLWYVELFDRLGFHRTVFLDEERVRNGGLEGLDVFVVSGGDTFAMARGLGPEGADRLRRFVENGGLYIGSCAGAYLPMNSSKDPLHLFNFAAVKITNLTGTLPRAERMKHKFCTAYGCDFIFHPVREEVSLRMAPLPPFQDAPFLTAPMYGGPGMIPCETTEVLATYEGFTGKTVFLVEKGLAEETLLGKAAAVRVPRGKGWMILLGPHFEHPQFPEANRFIAHLLLRHRGAGPSRSTQPDDPPPSQPGNADGFLLDLKREISHSRIVARSMEMLPVHWMIGSKIYEPEKIGVFLEALWKRIKPLEQLPGLLLERGRAEWLLTCAREATRLLRGIKDDLNGGRETHVSAEKMFTLLHRLSIHFLEVYFENRLHGGPWEVSLRAKRNIPRKKKPLA